MNGFGSGATTQSHFVRNFRAWRNGRKSGCVGACFASAMGNVSGIGSANGSRGASAIGDG